MPTFLDELFRRLDEQAELERPHLWPAPELGDHRRTGPSRTGQRPAQVTLAPLDGDAEPPTRRKRGRPMKVQD